MEQKIKNWLLFFVLIIMVLPAVQHKIHFHESVKLKGGYKIADEAFFTLHTWLDGSYQQQKEKYLNDQTGFRPELVRLDNQIGYSLFDKCNAVWTVRGKDNYLFQSPYINAYYGSDYQGYNALLERSKKMKAIQDTLASLGKSFILAYLPSKASYYPEYFPENRLKATIGMTNHKAYRRICDSLGINQVDLDEWFVSMKNKSKEPLFSKQGIHWSNYGAILGGDSLTRYMENLTGIHMKHPDWSQMEHTDKLRAGDDDVASELNLIFPVAHETMAYPKIIDKDSTQKKINAIYIGDSYAHKMIEFGIVYKMNGQCEFWRYFDEMHDINGHYFTYIKDYNWIGAIEKANCIVVSYTLFNFWQLGNGFIEQAYNHYYPQGVKVVNGK